jgi:predicted PolB exonuclease-like 3'-5' exonuclease
MPLHLQRVLVISCVFRNAEGLRVHSFVDREPGGRSDEARVIQQFFTTIEKKVPQLVSWNGGGFDLPVLHYRGLRHGVVANKYWDLGEDDREFKFNNYIGRYHTRHLDLMDVLAMYQPRASAPLDAMARLCGFPGKLGMDGSAVYGTYLGGGLEDIRRYCETDVMNTYLLYCRFQRMRGGFTEPEYEREIAFVRESLGAIDEPHWREYLAAWA